MFYAHKKGQSMSATILRPSHRVCVLVIFVVLLLGCRPVAAPTPSPTEQAAAVATAVQAALPTLQLVGTAWRLESFGEPEDNISALPTIQPTLNFFVERYAGYGGCNWFLGVYSVNETELRLNTPADTQTLCDEPGVMEQEGTYMSALWNIISYAFEGEKLVGFTTDNQRLLTFVPAELLPLEETTWQAAFIDDGERGPVYVIPGSQITLIINGDKVSGSGGCNNYTTTGTFSDGEVTMGPAVSTRMACAEPQGVMDQEQRYLNVLATATSYAQGASSLILYNSADEPVILFGARPGAE